jgi:hypothetical protein
MNWGDGGNIGGGLNLQGILHSFAAVSVYAQ